MSSKTSCVWAILSLVIFLGQLAAHADEPIKARVVAVRSTRVPSSDVDVDMLTLDLKLELETIPAKGIPIGPSQDLESASLQSPSGDWEKILQGTFVVRSDAKFPPCTWIVPGRSPATADAKVYLPITSWNPSFKRKQLTLRLLISTYCQATAQTPSGGSQFIVHDFTVDLPPKSK